MNRTSVKTSTKKQQSPQRVTKRNIKTVAKKPVQKKKVTTTTKRAMSTGSFEDKVIGVIGLGNMGGHMAHNLVKKGHNIVVYDIFEPNVETAVSNGKAAGKNVHVAKSPYEVAMNADVVVTMLPKSPHVLQTFTDENNGLIKALKDRKAAGKDKLLLIDSSTIAPLVTKQIHELVGDQADVIDAPVSGGVMGAENGTLTFMVGAEPYQFELAKPVLSKMGKNIVLCGPTGSGQAAKVCNNLILGISMNAIAEGYNLGVKLGMDPKVLAGIINTSSGRCWASEVSNPVPGVMPTAPASRDYNGGFGVDLMLKDMNLALETAESVNAKLELGQKAADNYQAISNAGHGKKDFGYVYQHVSKM